MDINQFIAELRAIDTYNVDVDSDGFLYTERNVDGIWINAWSLECLIREFEKSLNQSR